MTSAEKHEIQLATVAGCIEYLSGEPKCRIAARKLMGKLRTEQMRLNMGGGVDGHVRSGCFDVKSPQSDSEYQASPSHPNLNRDMALCALFVLAMVFGPYAFRVGEYVVDVLGGGM
jgi:hypothetical protein